MRGNLIALVKTVSDELIQRQLKMVTAESCTGGGLAYYLTNMPGASAWFERGFVTYSNAAKNELLGVSTTVLNTFGAVSAQTAREMAEGALRHSQAQVSIAITGIAGPDGGTADKPVGTVWFGYAGLHETQTFLKIFSGSREEIRQQSIFFALEKLLMDLTR